jgi:hypothetical protein
MNARDLAKQCVAAADALVERAPWRRFSAAATILFDVPGRAPIAGAILTPAPERPPGVMWLVGDDARSELDGIRAGALAGRFSGFRSLVLSMHVTRTVEIDEPFTRVLRDAGRQGRTSPLFLVAEAGGRPRPPRKADLELFLCLLRALLAADQLGAAAPESGTTLRLRITGDPLRPTVAMETANAAAEDRQPRDDIDAPRARENAPELDRGGVPSPSFDDPHAWQLVDERVSEQLGRAAVERALHDEKAWKRYFGAPRRASDLTDEQAEGRVVTYLHWFALRHRGTPKSRTVAERVLATAPSPRERAVLEARIAAQPSFYRVGAVTPGESIDLVDILTGREHVWEDRFLSTRVRRDVVLVLRLYTVGSVQLGALAGPPIAAMHAERALAFLEEELGIEIEAALRAESEHVLGRLWDWSDTLARTHRVELRNSDGNALLWHTARFHVADPAELQRALAVRPDIDVREPGAEWVWHRRAGANDGPGERVLLGTLALRDDELVLEVNSKERFERARAFLANLPGVAFASVTQTEVDPRRQHDLPRGEALAQPQHAEMTGEMRDTQRALIREMCMQWLDTAIPALGGLTPRAACATEAGRRRVARMIRAYPEPADAPAMTVPRHEMLAELGLLERGPGADA